MLSWKLPFWILPFAITIPKFLKKPTNVPLSSRMYSPPFRALKWRLSPMPVCRRPVLCEIEYGDSCIPGWCGHIRIQDGCLINIRMGRTLGKNGFVRIKKFRCYVPGVFSRLNQTLLNHRIIEMYNRLPYASPKMAPAEISSGWRDRKSNQDGERCTYRESRWR